VPRRWLLLPELPRTALGKVNRAALAARAAGGSAHG
jgi:acyl-coenzyme A synthetase/AMP-(fatty) acid ligase